MYLGSVLLVCLARFFYGQDDLPTNEIINKMFIASIWCAVSPNIPSITASRVFQGFGLSALQRYLFLVGHFSGVTRKFYFYSLFASTIEQLFL